MARKLTVTINGRIAGTRKTDRSYTHVVVMSGFAETIYRADAKRSWSDHCKGLIRHFAYFGEAMLPTYRNASVVTDVERARYAAIHNAGLDAYIASERAAHDARVEAHVAKQNKAGPAVLSWHSTRELAYKACAAAGNTHNEYLATVHPVDAA